MFHTSRKSTYFSALLIQAMYLFTNSVCSSTQFDIKCSVEMYTVLYIRT